jgi:hypothetical protein
MKRKRMAALSFALLLSVAGVVAGSLEEQDTQDLSYKPRGNRNEGQKGVAVSSPPAIELVSAVVEHKERVEQMPAQFKLKFYLKQQENVFVVVRELNDVYHYWLDNVTPSRLWAIGFQNDFQWPTADVIQNIKNKQGQASLKMHDLGVVARLVKEEPSDVERVAPAIFYHSQVPRQVTDYSFYFKTARAASLEYAIYKGDGSKPLFTSENLTVPARVAFPLSWNAAQATEGWYRLVLSHAIFSDNNDPINQEVVFYHKLRVSS